MPIRSVAILLHERDHVAESANYRIWALAANWMSQGIRVDILRGTSRTTDADLLIPHIDLSYIPDDYWAFIQHHPNVVNRTLRDIRKTRFSVSRLGRDDSYPGPVLVKTVGNCNGFPDVWFGSRRRPSMASRIRTRIERIPWVQKRALGWTRTLTKYRVFSSLRDVPRAAFANPHLLIERFIPERRGDKFVLRQWIMFGSQSIGRELTSTQPIIKSYNSEWAILPPQPPPEIVHWRRELGVDYCKMDYVIHEGKGVLLDVNPTPTLRHNVRDPKIIASAAEMAVGIHSFEPLPVRTPPNQICDPA
jgi:hypothetical protein